MRIVRFLFIKDQGRYYIDHRVFLDYQKFSVDTLIYTLTYVKIPGLRASSWKKLLAGFISFGSPNLRL